MSQGRAQLTDRARGPGRAGWVICPTSTNPGPTTSPFASMTRRRTHLGFQFGLFLVKRGISVAGSDFWQARAGTSEPRTNAHRHDMLRQSPAAHQGHPSTPRGTRQRSKRNRATYAFCTGGPAGHRARLRQSWEAQAPSESVAQRKDGPMEGPTSHLSPPFSSPPAPHQR